MINDLKLYTLCLAGRQTRILQKCANIGICRSSRSSSIGHSPTYSCTESRLLLPEGVGEGHDGVADELELRLELRVGGGEALAARAAPRVVAVVGRRQRARVAALEVVLPELCNR